MLDVNRKQSLQRSLIYPIRVQYASRGLSALAVLLVVIVLAVAFTCYFRLSFENTASLVFYQILATAVHKTVNSISQKILQTIVLY